MVPEEPEASFDRERRRLLLFAGIAGTALTLPASGAGRESSGPGITESHPSASGARPISTSLDTRDPEQNLRVYMKVLSDLDDRPTFRFHTGRILSVAPGQLGEPLLDFVACKQDRVRQLADGSYQHGYRGVILFTDIDTGQVLDTFANPLTGKTNRVQHFRTSWGSGIYSAQGRYSLGAGASELQNASALRTKPFQLAWSIVRDDVWITYDERVVVRSASGSVQYADSSMYRYHTSLRQLLDPGQTSADAIMSWGTETSWWPWMEMGGRPGHLLFGSMGRKYPDLSSVPGDVIAAAERLFPGQLTEPIDWAALAPRAPGLNR